MVPAMINGIKNIERIGDHAVEMLRLANSNILRD
jgi:phosphate uptake regulator